MFEIKSPKAFIDTAYPKPPFYVDGLVPSEGITLIFGPPSVGKTTLLWTMAKAMREQQKFLGEYDTRKALTLLINLDMRAFQVHTRLTAAKERPGFWPCNFDGPINITSFKASHPMWWDRLHRQARRFQVIMIDSLSTLIMGLSLKDDWVPGIVVGALRELFPHQAIILLHHSRKQQMGPHGPLPPHHEDALGSNLWKALVQSEIQMYDKGNRVAHVELVKSQCAALDPGLDVYVDEVGAKVIPYTANLNNIWLQKLSQAETIAQQLDPLYKTKPRMDRYTIMGKMVSPVMTARTIRLWVTRTKYQMIQ